MYMKNQLFPFVLRPFFSPQMMFVVSHLLFHYIWHHPNHFTWLRSALLFLRRGKRMYHRLRWRFQKRAPVMFWAAKILRYVSSLSRWVFGRAYHVLMYKVWFLCVKCVSFSFACLYFATPSTDQCATSRLVRKLKHLLRS